jgi:hypothetical protein
MLTKWCLETGLWCMVLNAAVTVLSMDPAPWVAKGPRAVDQLARLIHEAEGAARKLQHMIVFR